MAYTALQLITRAFYLSQVVARDLQTPTGDQITDGLYLLNALLDIKGTDLRLIPYFQRSEFDTVQGTEDYFVENLYYVDSMTFNMGDVRYSMYENTRKDYFASPRIDGIQSLPFSYRVERELGGSRVYMYFVPNQVYTVKISGKFALTDVDLNTDLSTLYDTYYIEYLRYGLAEYICSEWGVTFPDSSMAKFKQIEKKLLEVSPADLSITKRSYFQSGFVLDWQQINIGQGWQPY